MSQRAWPLFVSLALGAGCHSAAPVRPDLSALDAGGSDAAVLDAAVLDGTVAGDSAVAGDAGVLSTAAPPAVVLQPGGADLLLRGVVLTPTGALAPGDVLVVGGLIACVAADCSTSPGAAAATWIDTGGVISPGLIDAHNHLAYDFLPEWVPNPPKQFQNRYEWADDPQYEAFILPYSKHRSDGAHFCPAAKWGELRSLIHATTTVQGEVFDQSCIDWGVRNADNFQELGYDYMQTNIGSVRDLTTADATALIANIDLASNPTTRYAVHMAEGYAGNNVELEFDSFAGRDPRANRHSGTSLLYKETSILIHSMALTDAQLMEVAASNAKIVWSPSSNLALYGRTAPIQRILQLGIKTGIGPDWTPSGEDELLSEMRFAEGYAANQGIPEVTSQKLWQMATDDGALVVGLQGRVGRIEVGQHADLAVFGRVGADPYQAVIDSRARDVRLVLIDGRGWYGDAALQAATARNTFCDRFDACGTAKYLCVQDSPTATNRRNETYSDLQTQLFNILEGVGYPADEQYGRGNELLPLVDCSR